MVDNEKKDLEQGNKLHQQEEAGQEKPTDQIRESDQRIIRQVNILVGYYLISMLFSLWFLFDTWSNSFVLFRAIGVSAEAYNEPLLRTIGFTIVGGFLGNILYQIRVLFHYHTRGLYSPRWFGKYLTSPWEAAGMALVVLSLIRGGVALYGGSTGVEVEPVNNFAAIGTGALVGFGMRDVVGWLGNLVQTMFTIPERKNDEGKLEEGDGKE